MLTFMSEQEVNKYSIFGRRERLHCNSVNTENRDVVLSACKNSIRLLNYHMQSDVL